MTRRWRLQTVLTVLGLMAGGAPIPAQESGPTLSPEQLRDDLSIARGALEESHVGLYWFVPKPELDRRFEAIAAGLDRPITAREFHRRLLPLVASLGHGHTRLTLPVEGEGYRLRHLSKNGKYFPFEVRVLDERLYVVTDLSEAAEVGPGAEILAVDGRPAKELIGRMRLNISADGANDTFKMYQLGPGYRFHDLLDLFYGPSESFAVEFLPLKGGDRARRVVPAERPARMTEFYRQRAGREIDKFPPAYSLKILGDKIALLTIASFYEGLIPRGEPGFAAFFESAFRQIKEAGVEDLILDVRGNEGGNGDYVPMLYSYLADRPIRLGGRTVMASASLSYLPYAPEADDEVKAFAAAPLDFVDKAADGSWVLKEQFQAAQHGTIDPRPDRFAGRLYVLTDGGSYSATNGLVDLICRHHRREGRFVRFVGEQNGGDNAAGRGSGGKMLGVVLPHSKQKLDIPLLGGMEEVTPAEPVATLPDDRVIPSIRDVVAGTDRVLESVKESIARARLQGEKRK